MKKVWIASFAFLLLLQGLAFAGYIDNGDGTVADTKTGLMWQQETANGKNWQAALDYAEALVLAGYDDWRLPNIDELQSIVDYGRNNPSIDAAAFPRTVSSYYWSSTTCADGVAWCVSFNDGNVSNYNKPNAYAVRAVRGGQSRLLGSLVISAPAQAGRLSIGTAQTILWDTAGIAGNVKITFSRQGGKPGTFTDVIAENTPNNGSYAWTVTGPETFSGALRIEPVSDASKGVTQSLLPITNLLNAEITAEKLGDTGHYKLALTGRYNDGPSPLTATFTSSDVTIATIDSYGFLTALPLKNGYVEVSTVYDGTTFKKSIFVYTTLDAGESEGNNTKDVADVIAPSSTDATAGRFYKGTLTAGDTDWFKFTLTQGAIVNVGYLSQSSTADVRMDLYNAADTLMASATSGNGAPLILPVGLPAGDYYLKLTPAGDIDQTGNYIVTYKTLESLPGKTTIPIALGEIKTGTIDTLADRQEMTLTLASEQAIRILFSPSSPTAKYRITLLNDSQAVVDRIDCLDQKPVSFQAIYGVGSYTLQVTPLDVVDVQNPFTLSLAASEGQLEKEPNDAAAQATPFDITKPLTGRLSTDADMDFFTFQFDAPRFLELGFAATGSTGNFTLTLFKESDKYEIDGIDIANGQTTALHMGLGAGRYYLRVKGDTTKIETPIDTIHNYTLTFKDSPQTDLEIESNNTLKVANAIDKTLAKRGRIYSSQDRDYFGFNLPEGGFLSLTFIPTTATGGYKVSLVDENYEKTAAALYAYTSANGEAVSAEDLYIETPGNYYIEIAPNGGIDQYKPYALNLTSTLAIVGLKQLVNVAVTGTNETMTVTDVQTLTAKAGYSDATIANVTPNWTSLNPSVATVNGAGLVNAVAQGTTSIVASYGGITGKFDLIVGAPQNIVKQHYGNLILVAGGGIADTNTLRESTQYLSDLVYRRFKARLFADEDIYYLNPLPWHDINGDGFGENIVDETSPTVARFGAAIASWAAAQSTDGPLYLYLIDHGGIDNFMIFPGEIVTAEELKGWLDAFQTATNRKVIVMIEACKSGSFTDNLVVQGQNRIVITSTDNQDSYMQLAGRISFSQFFVDRLLTGDSLHQSYLKAKNQLANMGLPYSSMRPQLVEGIANTAVQTMIGGDFAIASLFPEIMEASVNRSIQANTTQTFYAKLSSMEGIESVWAVVTPPDYVAPSTSGDLTAPQVILPIIALDDPDKDKTYEGSYNEFTKNGDYRITFYARNANGNVTVSPQTVVTVAGGIETGKTLSVTKSGTGTGTVVSEPAGITCGSDCAETYNTPVFVTLTATADMGSIFTGWAGGGCGGTGTCAVAMDATKAITATFADIPPTGTITIDGGVEFTGSSTVTLNLNASDSNGISQMQFSGNNSDWSAPEPFSATKNWTLSPGDGLKTVWVKFQDNQGSWSEIYSYSISLDTRLPVTTATPPGGSYETAQLITLAADESATIYYTTDGTEPTESSTVYALPIPVGSSLTLKFFAKDLAGNKEQMKEAFYVIQSLLGANAGPDQLVFNQVVLDASGSTGAIVSYQWQLTHRTNPAYSRVATGIRPVLSNLSAGFYDVVLTVVGETGSSASEMTLAVVPENVVTDVRAGWFNQQQLDQAVNNANTAKDAIIAQKEQTITTLNTMISSKDQTIASMFTEQQLNQAVAEERIKWDVNNDGKIGLPEAIYILQKVAGAR